MIDGRMYPAHGMAASRNVGDDEAESTSSVLPTADQVTEILELWDRGDGKSDAHWCPRCGVHRCQHPHQLCPVCVDQPIQRRQGSPAA